MNTKLRALFRRNKVPTEIARMFPGKSIEEIQEVIKKNWSEALTQPCEVRYLLVQVEDADVDGHQIPASIRMIVELIKQSDGSIISVLPPLVLAVFGLPNSSQQMNLEHWEAGIRSLQNLTKCRIKFIAGAEIGLYGTFDVGPVGYFGPIISGFGKKVSMLSALDFGTYKIHSTE